MKVALRTSLDTVSGYGNDGVGLADAMGGLGWDVHLHPVQVLPPIPASVAAMLTKWPTPPFDLGIVHAEPRLLIVPPGMRRACPYVVGWSMWEFDDIPEDLGLEMRENLKDFDLVLSYDPVSFLAMSPWVPEGVLHRQVQGGFDPAPWEGLQGDRDWTGTFRFVMAGQLGGRKNAWAAIEAFNRLKAEHGDEFDAELHLKTNLPGLHPKLEEAYPGIKVHYAWWSVEQMKQFYLGAHCYVSTSRGEGKNVPALEALASGIPVIAPVHGGHAVWMSDAWGYALTWEPAVREGKGVAEVNIDHLTEVMWHVYTHRSEARQKGSVGARTIPTMCSWTRAVQRVMDLVRGGVAA